MQEQRGGSEGRWEQCGGSSGALQEQSSAQGTGDHEGLGLFCEIIQNFLRKSLKNGGRDHSKDG